MRILVDNGEHRHRDRGDVAVLQVAVRRLAELWPDDPIGVLTAEPARLRALVPQAVPVTVRDGWDVDGTGAPRPGLVGRVLRRGAGRRAPGRWIERVLDGVGLVVAGGGEYLTDLHPEQTERVLTLLAGAQERGIPTLMFGQGLGPLTDPRLRTMARTALPELHQLALRDGVTGPAAARELGVPEERLVVTGDDAVALSRASTVPGLGDGIGINHRIRGERCEYRHAALVRDALQRVAAAHAAPIVPVPVSGWPDEAAGIEYVIDGYPDIVPQGVPDDPPAWAIRRLDRVRVVVTSAYHLAVFALSRGVPVVCPVATDRERDAFHGLARLFSPGCVVVDLRADGAGARLTESVAGMWDAAEDVRPLLLEAADSQIATAERAYATARDLVSPPFIPRG